MKPQLRDFDSDLAYHASRYRAAKAVSSNHANKFDIRCRAMADLCRVVYAVRVKVDVLTDEERARARDILAALVGEEAAQTMTQPLTDDEIFRGL